MYKGPSSRSRSPHQSSPPCLGRSRSHPHSPSPYSSPTRLSLPAAGEGANRSPAASGIEAAVVPRSPAEKIKADIAAVEEETIQDLVDLVVEDQSGEAPTTFVRLFSRISKDCTGLEWGAKVVEGIARKARSLAKLTVKPRSAAATAAATAKKQEKEAAKKLEDDAKAAKIEDLQKQLLTIRVNYQAQVHELKANQINDGKTIDALQKNVVPSKMLKLERWKDVHKHIVRVDFLSDGDLRVNVHDFRIRLEEARRDEAYVKEKIERLAQLKDTQLNDAQLKDINKKLEVLRRSLTYYEDLAIRMDISLTKCQEVIARKRG